jgi:hypothetical protein
MPKDLDNTNLGTATEVRRRLADRLGFLLAKQWIRVQQQPQLGRGENESRSSESKQPNVSP